jgi:hypothetical protein
MSPQHSERTEDLSERGKGQSDNPTESYCRFGLSPIASGSQGQKKDRFRRVVCSLGSKAAPD